MLSMQTDMPNIVTRFAPSPTGFLHIGGARTALYNWLFARRFGGKFLLRIEDTDRKRSTDEAIEAILDGMKWLELDWDGEAESQFARAARHKEVAEELLEKGKAYRCYASPDELTNLREKARADGETFYGDIWRDKDPTTAPTNTPYVIRLKMPREGETTLNDLVQGSVTVANKELDDMVLLRSDGTPTYMLSVVVDDYDMGVTHVIRGDDHLNNAFRQHQIYQSMQWDTPHIAHIPLIHGPDGKKLSKRHGALGVDAYKDMGYLPESMRNYLLRLGWSHGDDEIIPTSQALEWFDLEHVGKSPARFDFDKLDNLNHHYLENTPSETLLGLIKDELAESLDNALTESDQEKILKALPSLANRAKRLSDLIDGASLFCNIRPLTLDEKSQKQIVPEVKTMFSEIIKELQTVTDWKSDVIKEAIFAFASAQALKPGKVMQPIRAAITGGKQYGDLVELMEILGMTETIARLHDQTL